jgi:hypothetical protein
MKKIVGIIAALAMAGAVFAADISAKVVLEGELFSRAGNGDMTMFNIKKPSDQAWNPIISTSASSDSAGAEFVLYTGNWEQEGGWNKAWAVGASNFKLWMAPADGFKLIFGHNAFNLNQEHITWSKTDSGIDDKGYSIAYSADGLGFDFMLAPGWGSGENWLSKPDGGDATIGLMGAKFQYGADFGTVNFIFTANHAADKDGKEKNFNDLKFGAGYANNFSGINMFVNVLGYMKNGFDKLRVELYAEGNAGAFGWALFPVIEYLPNGDATNDGSKINVPLWAKFSYKLDPFTAYVQIEDPQGLTKIGTDKNVNPWDDGFIAKVGANGNLGGAGWDVALKIHVKGETAISVPVSFNYAW